MNSLEDLTAYKLNEWYQVPNAHNEAEYRRLKLLTPARLGVWHCGAREMTNTMLRFRADHAALRTPCSTNSRASSWNSAGSKNS
jgi:ethanolamine ammonia-lyase small subunit